MSDISFLNEKNMNKHSLLINLQTLHHPQETKVQNSLNANPKPYVYGKLNAAGVLRISYGYDKLMTAPNINTANISLGVSCGSNIGLLKPYYIRYLDPESSSDNANIMIQNQEVLNNQSYISGPANWTRGFKEIDTKIGMNADFHINIKWKHSYYLQNWKTGFRVDYFPKGLRILHLSDNQIFSSIYTSYSIGKR